MGLCLHYGRVCILQFPNLYYPKSMYGFQNYIIHVFLVMSVVPSKLRFLRDQRVRLRQRLDRIAVDLLDVLVSSNIEQNIKVRQE